MIQDEGARSALRRAEKELARLPTDLRVSERNALAKFLPPLIRSASHCLGLAASTTPHDPEAALVHLVFARAAISEALDRTFKRLRRS